LELPPAFQWFKSFAVAFESGHDDGESPQNQADDLDTRHGKEYSAIRHIGSDRDTSSCHGLESGIRKRARREEGRCTLKPSIKTR
jgi:hypothetical protein